jgi:hypothetical protein
VAQQGAAPSPDLVRAREKTAVLEAALKNLQASVAKEKAVAAQLTSKCEALTAEVAQLRAQLVLAQADRDKAFKSLVETTDAIQKARAENQQLAAENKKLRALAEEAGILSKKSDTLTPPAETATPPSAVQGAILDVQDGGTVVISLGTDDDLRQGHRLHVYRNLGDHGIYVGRIEIVQTESDTAKCKIVELQDSVRKGDRVVTKL